MVQCKAKERERNQDQRRKEGKRGEKVRVLPLGTVLIKSILPSLQSCMLKLFLNQLYDFNNLLKEFSC
jgi:hypothetical protein